MLRLFCPGQWDSTGPGKSAFLSCVRFFKEWEIATDPCREFIKKKKNFRDPKRYQKMYVNIIHLRQEQGVGGGGMN